MRRNHWLIVVVLLFLGWQWWSRQEHAGVSNGAPTTSQAPASWPRLPTGAPTPEATAPESPATRTPASADADLPAEVQDTLRLIAAGGPFPYERDGLVFGNFERRLPAQPRGYYHEYTVPTPGASNRGARRIITGGQPPDQFWYTGDHYETFRRIGGPR
jgi:guanyl-specific ribonuclease Sa